MFFRSFEELCVLGYRQPFGSLSLVHLVSSALVRNVLATKSSKQTKSTKLTMAK